jgi:DNA-directed RNA polymerase specialized sigma24 family protein
MGQIVKSSLKQNWVPTKPAFRRFLEWLDEGKESHGERYLEMRRRLARYFDRRNCLSADELADETLNRVARRLDEQGVITEASPARYCYIVAKFVFLEHVRQAHPQVSARESDFSDVVTAGAGRSALDAPEAEQKMLECLELCLEKLLPGDRDLILEYYRGEQREKIQRRRELAERLGLTTNAVSIRACRIRDRLEECVKRCSEEK